MEIIKEGNKKGTKRQRNERLQLERAEEWRMNKKEDLGKEQANEYKMMRGNQFRKQ